MSDLIEREQITLDMLKVGVVRHINRELLNDARFVGRTAELSPMVDYLGHSFALYLRAFVLAHKVDDQSGVLKFDSPASWWQHLKLTLGPPWFPRWFLRRWPVRFRTTTKEIHYEAFYNYPDARIALPEEKFGHPVLFERITPVVEHD